MRIMVAQINPMIGDIKGNTEIILRAIHEGRKQLAEIVLFPELAMTGYPPKDFLLLPHFLDAVETHLNEIIKATGGIIAVVGLPRRNHENTEKNLFNSAAIIKNGALLGYYDKILLPDYDVFDERRFFEPGPGAKTWNLNGKKTAVTICEDMWQHSGLISSTNYRSDPILDTATMQPDLVLNLSASPYSFEKTNKRISVSRAAALTLKAPFIVCNQVGGNDSLIFDGYSSYVDENGELMGHAKGFEEDLWLIDLYNPPFTQLKVDPLEDLYKALVLGVKDYFKKAGFQKACLGLSGGVDSALVACIAKAALGKENVLGVLMPSRFTSKESLEDARKLAVNLGIALKEISIEAPFESYLKLLKPHFEGKKEDKTEENLQARVRGMILMALSNKLGHIVLSTGNKSELAMGYATLYGDLCGGLGVISDINKQQVYSLSNWINKDEAIIPWNTIRRPPSAELKADQKDSDTLPDYLIIDHVTQAYIEEHESPQEIAKKFNYDLKLVNHLIKLIHQNEYKRRQAPPGLRVSDKAFSVGRLFPIVQGFVR